jgi:REP element-mobilizing transposase RayT
VVNRGNYRRDVFESAGAVKSFVGSLEEVVQAFGWKLHAYAVMRNHYHLVLETPQPNLVEGMHWLQSAFSTRFNRFRSERGHLFQGRYHAGLIEDYRILAHVVDYVHLNPVRAGIIPVEQMDRFRWSSLGAFVRGPRFKGLSASDWLPQHGCEDNPTGWKRYLVHLQELAGNLEEQKRLGWEGFSHGWALGSEAWRKILTAEHAHYALNPGLEASAVRELRVGLWEQALAEMLKNAKRRPEELLAARKGEPWKVELALHLRKHWGVSCVWLANTLYLGTTSATRSLLCRAKASQNQQSAA